MAELLTAYQPHNCSRGSKGEKNGVSEGTAASDAPNVPKRDAPHQTHQIRRHAVRARRPRLLSLSLIPASSMHRRRGVLSREWPQVYFSVGLNDATATRSRVPPRALLSLLIPLSSPVLLVSWQLVLPSNPQLCLLFRSRRGRKRNVAGIAGVPRILPPPLLTLPLLWNDLDPRASCPW